jgi:hypothetical protein
MRFVVAMAMVLMTTPSFAEDTLRPGPAFDAAQSPLPPGKPAGVSEAATNNHELFIYISLGMIALTAAGVALNFRHHSSAAATPTTH